MYRGLLLDVYGTLVCEDDEVLAPICAHVAGLAGVERGVVAHEWWRRFGEANRAAHGDAFRLQRDLSHETLAETMRHFDVRDDAEALCRPQFAFWRRPPVFADSLPFLQQVGVPVCVVSNIDRADVRAALDLHHLPVDAVVTSEDARAYKPRPEPFELALSALGLQVDEVLHVGDSPSADVGGAQVLGMATAWINRKGRRAPAGCEPTFTAGSLHELSEQLRLGMRRRS
ncbi:HAD family hydrolase [Cellulomonas sp. S1-8]|uniref:HAD family hydrolase n=1 Tax=Cellulomonas sp. S1-8 TaxID=2904790 RepID=UPI002244C014|nr:HAD-IA family hydrolase [Cellulomonas sp. S1-8]UZN03836.1 HAD-IA family hydrolase [Cellulomonas sp. S1-8]